MYLRYETDSTEQVHTESLARDHYLPLKLHYSVALQFMINGE